MNLNRLKYLDLRDNPLICECSTIDFVLAAQTFGVLPALPLAGYLDDPEALTCTFSDVRTDIRDVFLQHQDCRPSILTIALAVGGSVLLATSAAAAYVKRNNIMYYFHLAAVRFKKYDSVNIEYEFDAFLGYSSSTSQDMVAWIIHILLPKLEDDNCGKTYKLFLEDRDMPGTGFKVANILDSMEKSHTIILLITREFLADVYCNFMVMVASTTKRVIIIFLERIAETEISNALKVLQLHSTVLYWSESRRAQKQFWKALEYALPVPQHYRETNPNSNSDVALYPVPINNGHTTDFLNSSQNDERKNKTIMQKGTINSSNHSTCYNNLHWPINDDLGKTIMPKDGSTTVIMPKDGSTNTQSSYLNYESRSCRITTDCVRKPQLMISNRSRATSSCNNIMLEVISTKAAKDSPSEEE